MEFYELTYIVEDEHQRRLEALAERFKSINGWNERELLQFAVSAMGKNDVEAKIQFLEVKADQLENGK